MYWHKKPPQREFNPKKRLGYVHVYTGEGKGKTTAALGVALRAAGHKMKVLIIHFVKGHKDYGEILALEALQPYVEIVQFGTPDHSDLSDPSAMDQYLAKKAMEFARRAMVEDRPDILILDEINTVAAYKLIDPKEVLDFIDNKHQNTELILTGRYAPKEFLNAADLITVMTTTKHPYDEDFEPRRGIEH
ncbi:MAG: cob(I)yrinic acid a,c-diamide adenosyltransferase [Candidatus Kerfeldbacteria bacterium CG15_BIG_FIL_POST_REV_8_21_14_020_45_12]|uniref:Cob(I)yrinic acid a,c-diamide adenosyltransferase n=1 Tax=Candidatus Kerfeldbacteria bacterium CG15_BIG_FIL_POST_REV_8_21_14_020_45_12 TaxID=2014247 RepID=A0A2M7H3M6_9BACT|nr:MAG: cob(I)yrinic acid a,c-diamide adenosyltransferase [Candidatus Kerfeldbacteria bacterium CG15_BIG_FIL_POST_REV_8_21_14_020_45_12]PJA93449.1 MAG: cob(I)yrinic acid a,c-diamide adenosyltransferase [Candidatus Kerfeldbacteria bacterium CG_4_9_14_3_um_filter_45_8]